MASGDASKRWFPEMIGILKEQWKPTMSWDELILLRDRLNTTLQEIRTTRQIKTPMMWCSKCQARHRAGQPTISVRAMILALGRFRVANEPEVKKLEKDWAKYRKEHRLDLDGKPETAVSEKPRNSVREMPGQG
ncbi:MAG: hypothetical protein WBM40_10810 [Thiohalocapsa sp.]